MKQFVCLSGLPRAGSTLLSAILSQNPLIHAEGNSAVCQLMWDLHQSCSVTSKEQLLANGREKITPRDIISQIPALYYKDILEEIVVDKCRSWTIPANVQLLENYVDKNFKIIVLERSVKDVVKSFVKLYRNNGVKGNIETKLIEPNSEPIMRSIAGINWAKKNNHNNNFIFIGYEDLINKTEETINKIYDFCGWTHFEHNFTSVESKYPENDSIYGLKGMHKVNKRVEIIENNVILSSKTIEHCEKIDKLMGYIAIA